MRNHANILVIIIGTIPCWCFSQQQINLSQSVYDLFLVSPSNAGVDGGSVRTYYKKNWLSIPQSPEKIMIAFDSPLPASGVGIGLFATKEMAGFTQRSLLNIGFSYSLALNSNNRLHFGICGGFQSVTSDLNQVKAESPEEFADQPQFQKVVVPQLGAGLHFSHKQNFSTGISVENMTQRTINFQEPSTNSGYAIQSTLRLNLFMKYHLAVVGDKLKYDPTLLVRSDIGQPLIFDFTNSFTLRKHLLIAAGYRSSNHLVFNAGIDYSTIRLIYTYEASLNYPNPGGGHEIGVTFKIKDQHLAKSSPSTNQNSDEIFELLQEQEAKMDLVTRKTDSLSKNLILMQSEVNSLKSKQINPSEVEVSFEEMNSNLETKHSLIVESQTTQLPEHPKASYQVVLGVYLQPSHAREYQKFLERTMSIQTILAQIEGQSKKYVYVCTNHSYSTIKEAGSALREIVKTIRKYSVEVTKGDPWILQTIKK